MLRLVSCRNYQEAVTGVTVKVLLRTHRQLSFKALIEGAMQECHQRPRNSSALWAVRWCLSPVWQNGTLLLKWPKLRTTKLWHLTVNIVHAATSAAASQTLPEHVKKEHMSHADNNILLWGVCALFLLSKSPFLFARRTNGLHKHRYSLDTRPEISFEEWINSRTRASCHGTVYCLKAHMLAAGC